MKKRKYVAVGTGGRITMFIDPISNAYKDSAELVGLCDASATRLAYHQNRLTQQYGSPTVPVYLATDFDRMLDEQRPDTVIVCTPDYLHHEYIVRALDFGADVISEKPLTIDAGKCEAIFDAIRRSGKSVRTTFNYRWSPGITKVRELIASGAIGNVKHIDFEYCLNTSHGADYFRRWHSQKECSGGLLVHKSTHHFDLLNWWTDSIPAQVFAWGDLVFYGKKNAIARGREDLTRYSRYIEAPAGFSDPFLLDINRNERLKAIYLDAEKDNGYIRDRNVFRDGITIEDSMSVMIKYRNGIMASYSLNAFSPIEGFRVAFSGDGGRLEYEERHPSHIITGDTEIQVNKAEKKKHLLQVTPLFSETYEVPIQLTEGGHGGGDPLIQQQMFATDPPADVMKRNAGHEQGAASLLVGAAANRSIATGQPVNIDDLVRLNPKATRLTELI